MIMPSQSQMRWISTFIVAIFFVGGQAISPRELTRTTSENSESSVPFEQENTDTEESASFLANLGRGRNVSRSKIATCRLDGHKTQALSKHGPPKRHFIVDRAEHCSRNGCGAPLLC